MRLGRVAAKEQHRLRIADVGVAVGHRAVAPGVGYAGDGGRMANARLVVGIVRPPVRRKLAIEIGTFVGELGRTQPVHRLRARLGANFVHLVADLVDGGVPRNPCPLAVHQFHRITKTTVAMHQLAGRSTLGAMRATVDRAFPSGLLTDPDAVRDFGDDGATDRTMRADILANGGPAHIRSGGFGLLHAGKWQRTDCRKAAGDETGTAQEATTIETNARLTADCRC